MEMFLYILLAAVLYGLLAEYTDRAIEREMRQRRRGASEVDLVEDFDARPDLGARYGRLLRRKTRPRAGRPAAVTYFVNHRA